MIKSVQVWYWKHQARKHYYRMGQIADTYDCGIHLVAYLSIEYVVSQTKFDAALSKLRALGEQV